MSDPARLDVDGALGRERGAAAVEMRLELDARLVDHAPARQAEDLVAAAVGEDRPRPADEAVQAAAPRDQLVAGPQQQVIGVAEDDLRADLFEVARASSPSRRPACRPA